MQPPRSDQVARGIAKLDPADARSTKEQNYWLEVDGKKSGRVTVPKGKKPLPRGTWGSICRQAGLTQDQMQLIVGCTHGYDDYVRWIREARQASKSG